MTSSYSYFPIDLLYQTIPINTTAGIYPYTFNDIDAFTSEKITLGIFQGVRLGVSVVTMAILLMLQRRKTAFFALYMMGLIFIVIHASLTLAYVFGPFYTAGSYLTGSYAEVTMNAIVISCVASVFQVLIIVIVEVCLLLHVNVMLTDITENSKSIRYLVVGGLTVTCVLPTIAFWLYFCYVNNSSTVNIFKYTTDYPEWITNVASPYFAATVIVFTLISSVKLIWAIKSRRGIGLKQLSIYQALFIMLVQTMIIPATLTLVEAIKPNMPTGFSSLTSLLVVVFLPLAGIWARFNMLSPDIDSRFLVPLADDTRSLQSLRTDHMKSPARERFPRSPFSEGGISRDLSKKDTGITVSHLFHQDSLQETPSTFSSHNGVLFPASNNIDDDLGQNPELISLYNYKESTSMR